MLQSRQTAQAPVLLNVRYLRMHVHQMVVPVYSRRKGKLLQLNNRMISVPLLQTLFLVAMKRRKWMRRMSWPI